MPQKKTFFSDLVDKHFAQLIKEYGFKKIESDSSRGEYWVKFQNKTTGIRFYCELLIHYEDPWIKITDLKNKKSILFETLLHELGIEQLPKFGEQSKRMKTVEEFEARLKQKSHQFFAYASDFLNGNFSTLPELIDFEQRRLDEHEEYMKSK